jgi:hypothetical protein
LSERIPFCSSGATPIRRYCWRGASRSVLLVESVDDAHVEAGAAVDHVLSVHVRSLEPVITTPAEQDVSVTDEDARVSLVVAPQAVYLVG